MFVWLLFFRNDQLQQEINVLQDRNKTDLTNLKKSLDDAIERCWSDKCIYLWSDIWYLFMVIKHITVMLAVRHPIR